MDLEKNANKAMSVFFMGFVLVALLSCTNKIISNDSQPIRSCGVDLTPDDMKYAEKELKNYTLYLGKTKNIFRRVKVFSSLPGRPQKDIKELTSYIIYMKEERYKEEQLHQINIFINSSVKYDQEFDAKTLADDDSIQFDPLELFAGKSKTGSLGFVKLKEFIAELCGYKKDDIAELTLKGQDVSTGKIFYHTILLITYKGKDFVLNNPYECKSEANNELNACSRKKQVFIYRDWLNLVAKGEKPLFLVTTGKNGPKLVWGDEIGNLCPVY